MNLGVIEVALLERLRGTLGDDLSWRRGPATAGPATGLRPEVFLHAARFDDALDGRAGRFPARRCQAGGWREDRPARIEVDVACVCGRHDQAQALAGLVAPRVLEALARLPALRLSDPADAARVLRFTSHGPVLAQQRGSLDGDAAQVLLTFHLSGILQVLLLAPGGLAPLDPHARPLSLRIDCDPAGRDLKAERVCIALASGAPLDLGGWQLADAAGHAYHFAPGTRLQAGQGLSLWTARGRDGALDLHWGRRKAVWSQAGERARLLDPEGQERASATAPPPQPSTPARRQRSGG